MMFFIRGFIFVRVGFYLGSIFGYLFGFYGLFDFGFYVGSVCVRCGFKFGFGLVLFGLDVGLCVSSIGVLFWVLFVFGLGFIWARFVFYVCFMWRVCWVLVGKYLCFIFWFDCGFFLGPTWMILGF